jgi:hypothetical protein
LNSNGGYSEIIKDDIIQVTFQGNKQQNQNEVRMLLIYRCSEITLENGLQHFILIEDKSYKHIGKKEFGNSDFSFETTASMSGGTNNRVKSNFGPQGTNSYFVGIFSIKMLDKASNRSVNASTFIRNNAHLVKN